MADTITCPHCGQPIKFIPQKSKRSPAPRRGVLHHQAPALPPQSRWRSLLWFLRGQHIPANPQPFSSPTQFDDPQIVLETRLSSSSIQRDVLTGITYDELRRIAHAVINRANENWSRRTLRRYGKFSDSRAFELGQLFQDQRLLFVNAQNRSIMTPRCLAHLRRVASESTIRSQATTGHNNGHNGF